MQLGNIYMNHGQTDTAVVALHCLVYCRLEAMQTLGLYCLLEGIPRPEGQVAALRAGLVWQRPQAGADDADAEENEAAIRVVAAKALCDWALIK